MLDMQKEWKYTVLEVESTIAQNEGLDLTKDCRTTKEWMTDCLSLKVWKKEESVRERDIRGLGAQIIDLA